MKRQRSILRRSRIILIFISIILINVATIIGQIGNPNNRSRIENSNKLVVIKLPTQSEADLLTVSKIEDQLFIGDRNGMFKYIEIPEKGYIFPTPVNVPLNQNRVPIRQILFLSSETGYVLKGNSIFAPKRLGTWMSYYTQEIVKKPVELTADFWSMDFSGSKSACIVGVNLRKEKGKDIVDGGLLICNQDFEKNPKDWKSPTLPAAFQNNKISSQLTGITFFGENGWLVGANGTIWSTKNGGEEWEAQESNTENPLLNVYAIDSNSVWAVGFGSTILHLSKNNSDENDEQNPNRDNNNDNKKNDPNKNKNSKKSKSEQKSFPEKVIEGVKEKFPSVIVTTTTTSTTIENKKVVEKNKLVWQNLADNPLTGQSLRLWSVKFAENKKNGWIVGDAGTILYTDTGGEKWKKVNLVNEQNKPLFPTPPNFYAMYIDDKYCWVVGGQGAIVRMEYK